MGSPWAWGLTWGLAWAKLSSRAAVATSSCMPENQI